MLVAPTSVRVCSASPKKVTAREFEPTSLRESSKSWRVSFLFTLFPLPTIGFPLPLWALAPCFREFKDFDSKVLTSSYFVQLTRFPDGRPMDLHLGHVKNHT